MGHQTLENETHCSISEKLYIIQQRHLGTKMAASEVATLLKNAAMLTAPRHILEYKEKLLRSIDSIYEQIKDFELLHTRILTDD